MKSVTLALSMLASAALVALILLAAHLAELAAVRFPLPLK